MVSETCETGAEKSRVTVCAASPVMNCLLTSFSRPSSFGVQLPLGLIPDGRARLAVTLTPSTVWVAGLANVLSGAPKPLHTIVTGIALAARAGAVELTAITGRDQRAPLASDRRVNEVPCTGCSDLRFRER